MNSFHPPVTFTNVTSRDFNQDIGRAKKAAHSGPVIITDRGRPAYVLLTSEAYDQLQGAGPSIVKMLSMPNAGKVEFKPARAKSLTKPIDFD